MVLKPKKTIMAHHYQHRYLQCDFCIKQKLFIIRLLFIIIQWSIVSTTATNQRTQSTEPLFSSFESSLVLEHQMNANDENSSSSSSSSSSNNSLLNLDHLKELREQIKLLASDTYRNARIYYGVAYFIIVILSFFGNLLVCKICFSKRTKTNALIMSLAVSDLLMTVFNIPFNFFRIANFSWPFGSWMCFVVNFVQHLVVYISSYTMAIIAIQRYHSVARFKTFEPTASPQSLNNNASTMVENLPISANSLNENNNDNGDYNNDERQQSNRIFCCFSISNQCYKCCACSCFCCCCWNRICSIFFGCWQKLGFWLCPCFRKLMENEDFFSMKVIYLTIVIIWFCSAFISFLFTYSSTIVVKPDASFLLEVLVNDVFNSTKNQSTTITNYTTDATFISANSSSTTSASIDTIDTKEREYLELFLKEQRLSSNNNIIRCRNPISENVQQFFEKNFSIKADFFKTITIFITQYFIPLAIICCLYIEIGKIIVQQGKMFNIRGNAKARYRQQKKLRRIMMLILMVAVFALCWLPLHIFHILTDIGLIQFNYQVFMMVHWLAMSSVSYNPFIYCWLNKSFRKAALTIFCCGQQQQPKSSANTMIDQRKQIRIVYDHNDDSNNDGFSNQIDDLNNPRAHQSLIKPDGNHHHHNKHHHRTFNGFIRFLQGNNKSFMHGRGRATRTNKLLLRKSPSTDRDKLNDCFNHHNKESKTSQCSQTQISNFNLDLSEIDTERIELDNLVLINEIKTTNNNYDNRRKFTSPDDTEDNPIPLGSVQQEEEKEKEMII